MPFIISNVFRPGVSTVIGQVDLQVGQWGEGALFYPCIANTIVLIFKTARVLTMACSLQSKHIQCCWWRIMFNLLAVTIASLTTAARTSLRSSRSPCTTGITSYGPPPLPRQIRFPSSVRWALLPHSYHHIGWRAHVRITACGYFFRTRSNTKKIAFRLTVSYFNRNRRIL